MATIFAGYLLGNHPGKETRIKATTYVRKELADGAVWITEPWGQVLSSGFIAVFDIDYLVAVYVRTLHVLIRMIRYLIFYFF